MNTIYEQVLTLYTLQSINRYELARVLEMSMRESDRPDPRMGPGLDTNLLDPPAETDRPAPGPGPGTSGDSVDWSAPTDDSGHWRSPKSILSSKEQKKTTGVSSFFFLGIALILVYKKENYFDSRFCSRN